MLWSWWGIIEVPEGVFLTGPIHLKDNINLFLSKNATIRFIDDPKRYLPVVFTRWEGVECYNYSPFVYSYGVNNVAITGEGTLDGNCNNKNWWYWCGKRSLVGLFGLPNQIEDRKGFSTWLKKEYPLKKECLDLVHI